MPTILRISENIKLHSALKTTIERLLGPSLDIQRIIPDPEHVGSFQTRIESLHQAFLFLCAAIPPKENAEKIHHYLAWSLSQWETKRDSHPALFADYQAALMDFTRQLVNAILDFWPNEDPINPKNVSEAVELLNKAEQYYLLTQQRPPLATLSVIGTDPNNLVLISNQPLAPFTQETIDELIQIKATALDDEIQNHPLWFLCLPKQEQQLLYHALTLIPLEDPTAVISLPSRLRTIPALANAAEESWFLINQSTGETIRSFGRSLRSAHIASRDSANAPTETHDIHTTRNLTQLQLHAGDRPLLIQTLISPLWLLDKITRDYFLEQQRLKGISAAKVSNPAMLSSNHPLNAAKMILWTPSDSSECTEILSAAESHLKALEVRDDIQTSSLRVEHLKKLIDEYRNTLNSPYGSSTIFDWNGRELFLSSLEHLLIMHCDGISYGSCVSGKDRKAIALIYTFSMLLYHHQYSRWPSFNDTGENRNLFVQIVTDLYLSRHHQYFSGQNAPGSNGIKTPYGYFPADISAAIIKQTSNPLHLVEDDRLASNNEVKDIVSACVARISPREATFVITALRLQATNQQHFLTLLGDIVKQKTFWEGKTGAAKADFFTFTGVASKVGIFASKWGIAELSLPVGLIEINKALNMHEREASTIDRIAMIFKIVDQRLNKPATNRDPLTQQLYQCIYEIAKAQEPNQAFSSVVGVLQQIETTANRSASEHRPLSLDA